MKLYRKIKDLVKLINEDNIFVYSAQASFYIIISSIPFAILLLSLSQYILTLDEQGFSELIITFIPDVIKPPIKSILSELFHKHSSSVISITAISSLWSASRGVAAIERGIQNVYHTPARSNFLLNIISSIFYTITFITAVIFFIGISIFLASIARFFETESMFLNLLLKNARLIWRIFIFFILTVFFSLIYMLFSKRKIPFKSHLPGALFSTFIWMIFSVLFSFYIENFANYSYIYGSLTAIVLLMLWIYFCMIIFLLGGKLNMLILIKTAK